LNKKGKRHKKSSSGVTRTSCNERLSRQNYFWQPQPQLEELAEEVEEAGAEDFFCFLDEVVFVEVVVLDISDILIIDLELCL
jgi:hypothetical protein